MLANVFYAVPVLVLVGLMVGSKNVNIDFGIWEAKGNQMQRPLTKLLESVSYAKLVRLGFVPNAELNDSFKRGDQAFNEIKTALEAVGEDLQFTDEGLGKRKRAHLKFDTVKAKWQELKSSSAGMDNAKAIDSFNGMIADVRNMITHSGDTSNLILDPDLDSYYLMDVTLLALSQTQDRLQDIFTKVGGWLTEGSMNDEKRVEVSVMAALLKQSDVDRITADFATVLTEAQLFW